jgi:diguanylate cyclase (GGDEF)-like protein
VTKAVSRSGPRRERPLIGVLAGWQFYERTTPNWFLELLFLGISDAARRLGCDVLLACGVSTPVDSPAAARPAWPIVSDDADFVPVGPGNTDGLVFISPLRAERRCAYARQLQADGFPVVFVGGGDGTPAVVADSEMGFRLALAHLSAHGHRSVAYIAGDPQDPGDSLARLSSFRSLRESLGLDPDEALIEPGLHSEPGGFAAMQRILARGHPFTAVLASNDSSAIGAMRALGEAGLRIPEDVAVVGFDDTPEAAAQVPPLATVRYPLFETGGKALERLVDVILGTPGLPDTIAIPTLFVGRRSCGCLPRDVGSFESPPVSVPGEDRVHATAQAMAAEAERAGSRLAPEAAFGLCRRLVQGVMASLGDGVADHFEQSLLELLQKIEEAGDRAHDWQAGLSRLRGELPALLQEAGTPGRTAEAEDLLHRARLALSESAEREGRRQGLLLARQADRVSALTVPLQSARDEAETLALLAEHAPGLGVRPVCVALYEPDGANQVARSRVRLIAQDSRSWSQPELLETRRVLDALPPSDASRTLAVLPLVRHNRPLGFLALEAANLVPCAAIARQLAVALESVRLQAAVQTLTVTDGLTGLRNRRFFEEELRREVERSRRFKRDVSLVMIDVDHFKDYNDSFGHRAGDEALRRVATLLVGATHRRLDSVSRYGGEEFAVVLAETDLEGARCVAERMREVVAGSPDFLRPLTISAGVATSGDEGVDPEQLVVRADQALYQAKGEGRNCVCVAP